MAGWGRAESIQSEWSCASGDYWFAMAGAERHVGSGEGDQASEDGLRSCCGAWVCLANLEAQEVHSTSPEVTENGLEEPAAMAC